MKHQNNISESNNPTVAWRVGFWITFGVGNLTLAISWLLAQVPIPRHGDVLLDIALRVCVAAFMLASILIARRIWKVDKLVPDRGHATTRQVVLLLVWVELVLALAGIVGLALFSLRG